MQELVDPPDQTGTNLKDDNNLKSQFALDEFSPLFCLYRFAKARLARGEKPAGLRILYALRDHLNQLTTENIDIGLLSSRVNAETALWGFGFDWD
jgi:hypothetical protein